MSGSKNLDLVVSQIQNSTDLLNKPYPNKLGLTVSYTQNNVSLVNISDL